MLISDWCQDAVGKVCVVTWWAVCLPMEGDWSFGIFPAWKIMLPSGIMIAPDKNLTFSLKLQAEKFLCCWENNVASTDGCNTCLTNWTTYLTAQLLVYMQRRITVRPSVLVSMCQINMPHYRFPALYLAEWMELFIFWGLVRLLWRRSSVGGRRWHQGERWMAEMLEIIDIPTKRLQMASWQMEEARERRRRFPYRSRWRAVTFCRSKSSHPAWSIISLLLLT